MTSKDPSVAIAIPTGRLQTGGSFGYQCPIRSRSLLSALIFQEGNNRPDKTNTSEILPRFSARELMALEA